MRHEVRDRAHVLFSSSQRACSLDFHPGHFPISFRCRSSYHDASIRLIDHGTDGASLLFFSEERARITCEHAGGLHFPTYIRAWGRGSKYSSYRLALARGH